jgi:DNA-binding MarR family transcriptional regulator
MGQDHDYDLLMLLHDVARLGRVVADKVARRHDMTRSQWVALLRLARTPGLTQKELADMLEVEPISVARLIDRMAAAGLIERRADDTDRRVWRLHLRAEAEDLLIQVRAQRDALAAEILQGLDPATQATIQTGLLMMKYNLLSSPAIQAMAIHSAEHPVTNFKESA